jgi:hypothetical protein
MKLSKLKKEDLTREVIDKILYDGLEESGDEGECIVVFGSSKANRYRVPKAASVYLEGRAPNILLCGGQFYETENWFKSEKGYQRAYDEVCKIISYINEKSIPDFEI